MRPFLDFWAERPVLASQRRLPQVVRDLERKRRLQNRPESLAACLRGLGTGSQPSLWDRLAEVKSPAMLLTGEEDVKFSRIAERMVERLPISQHVVVPAVGHAVYLEAPDAWLEAVTPWLSGTAGASEIPD
jgi:2-succinyl-6-hydroxy-2,4-cyclohexadiene-1-carboxylate synthase